MNNPNSIINRQEMLFKEMIKEELPQKIRECSEDLENYTIDYELFPVSENDRIEENGTIFIMAKAVCTITNKITNEYFEYMIELLKIPVYTPLGFLIRNNQTQVLDLYDRVAGWCFESNLEKADGSDTAATAIDYTKCTGKLLAVNKTSISLQYKVSLGMCVKCSYGVVPISVFLRAITDYSNDELMRLFGYDNEFIQYAFTTYTKTRKYKEYKSKSACIKAVHKAMFRTSGDSSKSVVDYQREIKRALFNKRYLNLGDSYSDRLERSMSFRVRATGKILAEDVYYDDKLLCAKGAILSDEILNTLDKMPIDSIKIRYKNKQYVLHKFSYLNFRGLNHVLLTVLPELGLKKQIIDTETLRILNESDLEKIEIMTLNTNKTITMSRRVHPSTLDATDLLTAVSIYADILNELDCFDSPYELTNRIVVPFDKKILHMVQNNLNEVTQSLIGKLATLPGDCSLTGITNAYNLDTDAFINYVVGIGADSGNEGQMADTNNAIHYISKSYKITTDIPTNNVSDNMTKVQDTQLGRTDPIDSPESSKIGLTHERTLFARETKDGFFTTPYLRVSNGKVVSEEPMYLTAQEESDAYIAEWNETFLEEDGSLKERVSARLNGNIVTITTDKVTLKEYSQLQNMSPARSMIPFMGNSNSKRLLMACNHSKQAVPRAAIMERPIVGTGAECIINTGVITGRDIAGMFYEYNSAVYTELQNYKNLILESKVALAPNPISTTKNIRNIVFRVMEATKLLREGKIQGTDTVVVSTPYLKNTEEKSIFSTRLKGNSDGVYKSEDIVIHNMTYDTKKYNINLNADYGGYKVDKKIFDTAYGIGTNLFIGFKTCEGSTIDDAITISNRLVYDDTLTSIAMVSKKVELHDNEEKFEAFGIPPEQTGLLTKLSANGLAKVGTVLKQGDPYACVIKTYTDSGNGAKATASIKYLTEFTEGQVIRSEIKEKDGKYYAEIILAGRVSIEVGDKMAGRCGNKGVIAKVLPAEEMPYLPETGEQLDIIVNPLGVPSRMNITQILEISLSYAMKKKDMITIQSPYNGNSLDIVRSIAESANIHPVMMIDGRTGQYFKRPINIGYQYMFKLVHQVRKKATAIGLDAPVDNVFNQPVKGQKKQGGQAFGEMESWCLQAIGANKVLQELYSVQSDDLDNKEALKKNIDTDPLYVKVSGQNNNDLVFQAYMRSLTADCIVEDGSYHFKPMSDVKIRSLSSRPVVSENDLHNEMIFGVPAKNRKGIKSKWSYIDLGTEIISPFWLFKGDLHKYIVGDFYKYNAETKVNVLEKRVLPASVFEELLYNNIFVAPDFVDGYPQCYKKDCVDIPMNSLTGMEGILKIFKEFDVNNTLAFYDKLINTCIREGKDSGEDYANLLITRKYVAEFIVSDIRLSTYIISSYPVMPVAFRPKLESNSRMCSSDFDKSYRDILKVVKGFQQGVTSDGVFNLMRELDQFIGLEKLSQESFRKNKQRTTILKWFTGSKNTSRAKHKGKIRENVLSKRLFCSGRSVIVPTGVTHMKPDEVGIPIALLLKAYKSQLVSFISKRLLMEKANVNILKKTKAWELLFNAIGTQNPRKFDEIYNGKFKSYCLDTTATGVKTLTGEEAYRTFIALIKEYIEGDTGVQQVVLLGRQPSLHQFSIRALKPIVVFTKAIQIHPLVCTGYNADFDGDTMWFVALFNEDAKEEAIHLMSPRENYVNPKDSSAIMVPSQDIALGIYCATMLKDNVNNIYKTPEVLNNVLYYSRINQLKQDVEQGITEYYSLVIFRNSTGKKYYSTAGRILFNSCIPDGFTDKPFTNTLNLPISDIFNKKSEFYDLKYDGIVAAKGGTRHDIEYCNLGKICTHLFQTAGTDCIEYYQKLTEFGFRASDMFAVTLSLDDIDIKIDAHKLQVQYEQDLTLLDDGLNKGIISQNEYQNRQKILSSTLSSALVGKKADDYGETDLKKQILMEVDKQKIQLEIAYQNGLLSAKGKKDSISAIYRKAAENIKISLSNAMDRNNNLFIIYDSGSRGNIGQIMQIAGTIGILQKTKTEDMEMPVTGNYAEGISSFDTHITSYSGRTGVASTQNETKHAGHATRTAINMLNGVKIVENDCGKTNWWYDVPWGDFENKVDFAPNKAYFEENYVGKEIAATDTESLNLFEGTLKNNVIQKESFDSIKRFLSSITLVNKGKTEQIDTSIQSLIGCKVQDEVTLKILREFLTEGNIINKRCLELIKKHHLLHINTDKGMFRLYYKLDNVVNTLIIGREASDVDVNGMKGLPYLEEVLNPNFKEGKDSTIKVVTSKTIEYIESEGLSKIPVRILLDCHSKNGVCAHCYGLRYTRKEIPLVGSNIGNESAQAMGEPSAQLTMSLFHKGGAAGESVAGGVEIFTQLLAGGTPGGKKSQLSKVADSSGYVHLQQLDDRTLAFVKPEMEHCTKCDQCKASAVTNVCPLKLNAYSLAQCKFSEKLDTNKLLVQDGEYVECGDCLSDGYTLPNKIVAKEKLDIELLVRKKQIVWLMLYFNTFYNNGILINARHFELMTRIQNTIVTVLNNAGVNDLEPGSSMEFGELLRKYGNDKVNKMTLTQKTSSKYEVVEHTSGALAMISFENSAASVAKFVVRNKKDSVRSDIADTFVGNDFITKEIKPLKQPVIGFADKIVNMYDYTQDKFEVETATVKINLVEPEIVDTKMFDNFTLDLSTLDTFEDVKESEMAEAVKSVTEQDKNLDLSISFDAINLKVPEPMEAENILLDNSFNVTDLETISDFNSSDIKTEELLVADTKYEYLEISGVFDLKEDIQVLTEDMNIKLTDAADKISEVSTNDSSVDVTSLKLSTVNLF